MIIPDGMASADPACRKPVKLRKAPVRPGSRIPGWMSSVATFAVVAGGGTILLARAVVPAVVAHAPVGDLHATVEFLTWLFLGTAALGGALADWPDLGRPGEPASPPGPSGFSTPSSGQPLSLAP